MKVSLVEFFVTEDKTYIFAIDTQKPETANEPWCATVDVTEEEIRAAKTLIWSFGKSPIIVQRNIEHFQQIGTRLLHPAIEYLDPCDVLYIVPHKDLHYLPLHAIEIDGAPLCDQFAIVYLPNASLLKFCQANNAARKNKKFSFNHIFSMGVGAKEDSPKSRKKFIQEAEELLEIFDAKSADCFTGANATKKRFFANAANCDLIHIASHGHFDNTHPLGSGPLLAWGRRFPSLASTDSSGNYVLRADEFYQLKLNANLVVLSGCFTGRNDVRPGDELLGLARGLFVAGVPSMMLSLWEAHHDATIAFVKLFYQALSQGTPKALAYQTAQKQLKALTEFQELRYWAPYILVGDWL